MGVRECSPMTVVIVVPPSYALYVWQERDYVMLANWKKLDKVVVYSSTHTPDCTRTVWMKTCKKSLCLSFYQLLLISLSCPVSTVCVCRHARQSGRGDTQRQCEAGSAPGPCSLFFLKERETVELRSQTTPLSLYINRNAHTYTLQTHTCAVQTWSQALPALRFCFWSE